MTEKQFQRVGPDYLRIQTRSAVANDLAVRVNDVRVYDPQTDRNTVTEMQFTGPVAEGAVVYVEAYKGFGVAYRLAAWEAAIGLRGQVYLEGGGFETDNVTAGNDWYPMGLFVPPSAIVVGLEELEPGVAKKLVLQFASGAIASEVWVPSEANEVRDVIHRRQDQVRKVWLLDIDEEFLPPT